MSSEPALRIAWRSVRGPERDSKGDIESGRERMRAWSGSVVSSEPALPTRLNTDREVCVRQERERERERG